MKKYHLLLIAALLLSFSMGTLLAGSPVVDETFDEIPKASKWISFGPVAVEKGELLLRTEGDGDGYTNTGFHSESGLPKLNFFKNSVTITLEDFRLGGKAPAEAQAFVVLLTSGKGSETDAEGFVRLCVNGDGSFLLAASGGKDEKGNNISKGLANLKVSFPLKKITIVLNKQGYELEIDGGGKTQKNDGKWDSDMDSKIWKKEDPQLTVKAVCRPAQGTVEAGLGSLKIESD